MEAVIIHAKDHMGISWINVVLEEQPEPICEPCRIACTIKGSDTTASRHVDVLARHINNSMHTCWTFNADRFSEVEGKLIGTGLCTSYVDAAIFVDNEAEAAQCTNAQTFIACLCEAIDGQG